MGKVNSQTSCTLGEGLLPTLKNLADLTANLGILQAAPLVGDLRKIVPAVWPGAGDDYLIGVGVDNEIGVVGDDDHLAAAPRFAEALDQLVENRLRIEVLLGLVDDKRPIVAL